jgi:polyribonucleotide nucleotidyltransferase
VAEVRRRRRDRTVLFGIATPRFRRAIGSMAQPSPDVVDLDVFPFVVRERWECLMSPVSTKTTEVCRNSLADYFKGV